MKKILFISSAFCMLIFTNCKKKEDPAPVNITVPGSIIGECTTGSSVKSGTLTIASESQKFDVLVFENPNNYALSGTTTTGNYSTFSATLLDGKPTTGQTIDFNTEQQILSISIGNSKTHYDATSGTATITVNGNKVTVSFMNLTFTAADASADVIASGSISSSL